MDFTYDEEQIALRDTVRRALTSGPPVRHGDEDRHARRSAWTRLAQLGVLDTVGPDGLGVIEAGIVAEEIGRSLTPVPYCEVAILGAHLLADGGSSDDLAGLIEGTHVVAFVDHLKHQRSDSITMEGEDGFVDGVSGHTFAPDADSYLLAIGSPQDLHLVLIEGGAAGVSVDTFRTTSGLTASRVVFDHTRGRVLAPGARSRDVFREAQARAQLAMCHQAIGAMEAALDITLEHLRTRHQFGAPLGSQQALKFRAADMYVAIELARSTVLWADLHIAGSAAGADRVLTHARLQVCGAATDVGRAAVQLHGGLGLTAEHPISHHHARLTTIAQGLGGTHSNTEALTQVLHDRGSLELFG